MEKLNKLSLSLCLALAFLMTISLVSAAITLTINSPATNGIFGGAFTTNVTIKGIVGSPADSYVNISYYMKSASTANSTWSLIGVNNSLNLTTLGNETIGSFNLSAAAGVEDGADYIFNVTVYNDTAGGFIVQETVTGIIVDYTEPATPTTLVPTEASVDEDGSVDFSATVSANGTTACTLFFVGSNPGNPSYAMTHSGATCTETITMAEQTYEYYITATDGSNESTSAERTFSIDTTTGTGVADTTVGVGDVTKPIPTKTLWIIGIIVAVVLFVIFRKK